MYIQHNSHRSCCCDQIPDRQCKRRRVYSGLEFKGIYPIMVGKHGSRRVGTAAEQGSSWSRCVCGQEAESDARPCSTHFLFLTESGTPVLGLVLPIFKVGPSHIHYPNLEKHLTDIPEACLQGDSRICQVDNHYKSSHGGL